MKIAPQKLPPIGIAGLAGGKGSEQEIQTNRDNQNKLENNLDSERITLQPNKKQENSENPEKTKIEIKERSQGFLVFLLILVASGNYFFGYQIAIFNVVSDPLLKGIFQKDESAYKSNSSLSGFLFSIGCLVGSVFQGVLTKKLGFIKLIYVIEFLNIATSILFVIQSLSLILALRFIAGILGGLCISVLPVICNDLFPQSKAAIGGAATYLFIVIFILLASLQNPFYGGNEGLMGNVKIVFAWPAIIGVVRIILMSIFLIKVETPKFLTDHFEGPLEQLRTKLDECHMLVYQESTAKEVTSRKILEMQKLKEQGQHGSGFSEIFSKKYRRRTLLGLVLSLCQQLGGINIMVFFSTQIFDDISGNGSTITLLISISNVLGAVVSIFLAGLRRIKVFSAALLFHAIGILGVSVGIWVNSGILAAIMVCLFTVSFAVGNGSMLFVYSGEILPSAAMGIAFASQWLISAVFGIAATPIGEGIGKPWLFVICGGFIVLDLIVLNVYGLETLGKTSSEIDSMFVHNEPQQIKTSTEPMTNHLPN